MSSSSQPLLTTIRRRLLKRSGPGGIVAMHRAFAVLDHDHNRQLDSVELQQAARMVGLDLNPQEVSQLLAALDKDGNGFISVAEFLRFLRGELRPVRMRILKEAFAKFDRSGNGVVDLEDLRKIYDVDRHPDVLKKTKTRDQVLSEFLQIFAGRDDNARAPPITQLSFDDFLNYYAGISAEIDADEDFYSLVKRVWQLDQIMVGNSEELRPRIQDGFQASAYWGRGDAIDGPPAAPGVVLQNAQLPIDPFPLPKAGCVAKEAQSYFDVTTKHHHKVLTRTATQWVLPAPEQHSLTGTVKTNPNSRGFMVAESTVKRTIGAGEHDPDVMQVFEQGRAAEMEAYRRRMQLEQEPFVTKEPSTFERSSQVHAALLPAVNRDRPANPRSPLSGNTVTEDDLRAVLEEQRQTVRAQIALGKFKSPTPLSTTQDHFARIDSAAAVAANDRLNASLKAKPIEVPLVEQGRNGYETEYSANMLDRHAECQRETKFDAKGTFKLVNGVSQLHPASHHPRSTLGPTVKLAPTTVIPNMFASTTHVLHR